MGLIVPGGDRFCICFKHSGPSAVFAISAMDVRGGILLRAWILMGFLSEKTGTARITSLLYCNGFSSDWTLVYSKALSWGGGGVQGDVSRLSALFLDNAPPKPKLDSLSAF